MPKVSCHDSHSRHPRDRRSQPPARNDEKIAIAITGVATKKYCALEDAIRVHPRNEWVQANGAKNIQVAKPHANHTHPARPPTSPALAASRSGGPSSESPPNAKARPSAMASSQNPNP